LADAVAALGFDVVELQSVAGRRGSERHALTVRDGRRFDVVVLRGVAPAADAVRRLYYWLRLSGVARRRDVRTMRGALEREVLLAHALRAARVRTPALVAVGRARDGAGVLVYEHLDGRPLNALAVSELTDDLLAQIWDVIAEMRRHRLVHRRLSPQAFVVDAAGQVWLTDLGSGELAAGSSRLRLDTVEALIALATVFGVERTVEAATARLGAEAVAEALPVAHPVVLTRATRAAVKRSPHSLASIRAAVQARHPEPGPPIRLERLSAKGLMLVAGLAVAGYALATVTGWHGLTALSPGWAAVVLAASALSFAAAAMALDGFVPRRLPWRDTVLVQIASSFTALVSPGAVGGLTLNSRYLQRRGLSRPATAAALGTQQAVGAIAHLALAVGFGLAAAQDIHVFVSARTAAYAAVATTGIVSIVVAVPALRRRTVGRIRPLAAGAAAHLSETLTAPGKLAVGLTGTVGLSLLNITALWAAVHAIDRHTPLSYAAIGFVYLTGQAAGSLSPTPGGLGGVEPLLAGELAKLGHVSYAEAAMPAVLVFRLATFFIPLLPGYAVFRWMQKRNRL
ncbi:MAG: flippase-like domain-containing protein, partial [Catenulispora sp.]|nr:flippase-like domain-containing protein [Catenulispora sp.]